MAPCAYYLHLGTGRTRRHALNGRRRNAARCGVANGCARDCNARLVHANRGRGARASPVEPG
eukprot:1717880-Lingulodinium_polyedra.AAC.1